jgi:hypothetical protein
MDNVDIREGMTVYSKDGKKLGKIIKRDGDNFVVEKGLFFKKDYLASLEDVERLEGDEVRLRRTADEVQRAPEDGDEQAEDRTSRRSSRSASSSGTLSADAASDEGLTVGAVDGDEGVVTLIEEEVVAVAAADEDDEAGGLGAPGRYPNARR